MSAKKGLLCMFIASVLLSLGGLSFKMIPCNGMAINAVRNTISVCLLLLFAKVTGRKLRFSLGVFIGACAMCATTTLYALANKLTTAANTILLQFTAPAFVILLMLLFFHEKPRKLDIIACVLVFGGIACFFLDSLGTGHILGDFLALISGVSYALVFMMNKFPKADPLFATILGQGMGAVIGFPFLMQETEFTSTAILYAIVLGVFQLGIADMFFTTGIRYAPPVSASLVAGIEPILNPVLVAIVLGEMLTPLAFVGGAIVFLVIMVYNVLNAIEENRALKETRSPDMIERRNGEGKG